MIQPADLKRLRRWVTPAPEAPDGDWFKDFGSFKLYGTGAYSKTVLAEAMRPFGEEVE